MEVKLTREMNLMRSGMGHEVCRLMSLQGSCLVPPRLSGGASWDFRFPGGPRKSGFQVMNAVPPPSPKSRNSTAGTCACPGATSKLRAQLHQAQHDQNLAATVVVVVVVVVAAVVVY